MSMHAAGLGKELLSSAAGTGVGATATGVETATGVGGGALGVGIESSPGVPHVAFRTVIASAPGVEIDYVSIADSGNTMHRRFCPACGTQMFSESEARPHLIIIRAGTLDDREIAKAGATIWTRSAPSWGYVDPDLPHFEGQAPAPPPVKPA